MISHTHPSNHHQLLLSILYYPMPHSPEFFSELVPFNQPSFLGLLLMALQLNERLKKSVIKFPPRTQALL